MSQTETIIPPPPAQPVVCTTCGNPVAPGATCEVDGTIAPEVTP